MRIIKATFFSFILTIFAVSNASAQCGNGFNRIEVVNSDDQIIRGVVIEIVAQLPDKEYEKELRQTAATVQLSEQTAENIIKKKLPMDDKSDLCGNPLKQRLNETKIKHYFGQKTDTVTSGFCAMEVNNMPLLLKISAADYSTAYYVGTYFLGCGVGSRYKFVLTGKRDQIKSKKSVR